MEGEDIIRRSKEGGSEREREECILAWRVCCLSPYSLINRPWLA